MGCEGFETISVNISKEESGIKRDVETGDTEQCYTKVINKDRGRWRERERWRERGGGEMEREWRGEMEREGRGRDGERGEGERWRERGGGEMERGEGERSCE